MREDSNHEDSDRTIHGLPALPHPSSRIGSAHMDLKNFNFPETTGIDIAFPTFGTDPQLLKEAKDRGFYNGQTPYNKLFSTLFFSGGRLEFKPDLDPEFKAKALPYLKAFMGSFAPKHEEKEAICALLLSELCNA